MLIPTRRRTWHPRGCTPIVPYNYKHERISAIAALSVASKRTRIGLYLQLRQNNFKAVHVAKFLRLLLAHLRSPLVLLWDSGNIHKGPAIREVRAAFPRLHLEPFPHYAPELNPVEQVWNDFKRHTGNSLLDSKQAIRLALHGGARRVRRSPNKLRSFVLASDIPSPPWT
jgi:transposase